MTLRKLLSIKIFEFTLFSILLLFFVACEKEQLEPITYLDVAAELCPYFQQFEEEAAARGLIIDLEEAHISGRLSTIQDGYIGLCASTGVREIVIDENFWKRSSELSKELIVFHELGHCFLERNHLDEKSVDGTCFSIMRSGKGGCLDFYTAQTRTRLLDELFQH